MLLIGGTGLKSTEIFDPETVTFTPSGSMSIVRDYHSAVVLKDGKVLVTGGSYSPTAEIYDPISGSFSLVNCKMTSDRSFHASQVLGDGKVLIAGGKGCSACTWSVHTVELFDPDSGLFSPVTNRNMERSFLLNGSRALFSMTLLSDGTSLLVGGTPYVEQFPDPVMVTERYNPSTGSFEADASTIYPHSDTSKTLAPLQDGSLLLAGEYKQVGSERYIPDSAPAFLETYLPVGVEYQDAITTQIPVRSYSVTYNEPRNLGVALKNVSAANPTWYVRVKDNSGQTLLYFRVQWFDMQHVAVKPGTYTIEISNYSGSFDNQYRLNLYSAPVEYFEQEPNDAIDGATTQPMAEVISYRGRIQQRQSGGDIDQYKVVLPITSRLSINFSHSRGGGPWSGSWKISLSNTNGTEQYLFISSGTELAKTDQIVLPSGTYIATVAAMTETVTDIPYNISVTSQPDSRVLNARASHPSGAYEGSISVSLTADNNASIYYTLDGSMPTPLSTKYNPSAPLAISTSKIVRFFARDADGVSEPVRTVEYVIRPVIDLAIKGNTTGSVTFLPSSQTCSGNCRAAFDAGANVSINATSNVNGVFAGWAGACSGTNPCQQYLFQDKYLEAYFYDSPVRIKSSLTGYYNQIQQAYNGASPGATIEARAQTFTEDLIFGTSKIITVKGGYNTQYNSQSQYSSVRGSVTIKYGQIIFDRITIL